VASLPRFGRAAFLVSSSSLLFGAKLFAVRSGAAAATVAALEARSGATIGISAIDTDLGKQIGYRARQAFPMASTVKLLVVMAVLDRVDRGADALETAIRFSTADLAPRFSTITARYPEGGSLSLREICALAISQSDNTAVDLLFKRLGGPRAVSAYLKRIGVAAMRVDRLERQLPASVSLHDPRDTATPLAMAMLLRRIAVDSPLSEVATRTLVSWMKATTTGPDRIRAAVPPGWVVAHKTGSYANAANDVGIIFPPGAHPIAVAVFVAGLDLEKAAGLDAAAARIVLTDLQGERPGAV
jgi:beta-lactamase class A